MFTYPADPRGEASVANKTQKRIGWEGFDCRVFLTDHEHATYRRRLPVRYAAKNLGKKPKACEVCGEPATPENPLQAAHRVPFGVGIRQFRLTPDWYDSRQNLIWAHRRVCNKKVELSASQIDALIREISSHG